MISASSLPKCPSTTRGRKRKPNAPLRRHALSVSTGPGALRRAIPLLPHRFVRNVREADGDYLLIVKENQATLRRAIATLFASRADAALAATSLPPWDMREATTVDKGHGRVEVRHLVASTALNDYLDWPGLAQVFIVERRWRERGHWQEAVRYGITSLPPAVADADRLLALVRGHWQIENGLHSVKDVTLGEDRSLIRKGHGPNIMAILRDTVISVLHRAGWRTIAERLRCYSGDAHAALALLGISLRENA